MSPFIDTNAGVFTLSPTSAQVIAQTAIPAYQQAYQSAVNQGFETGNGYDWKRYAILAGAVIVGAMLFKRL